MNKIIQESNSFIDLIEDRDKKIERLFPNIYKKKTNICWKNKFKEIKCEKEPIKNLPLVSSVILNKNFKLNKNQLFKNENYSSKKTIPSEKSTHKSSEEIDEYYKKFGVNKIDIDELNDPYRKINKINNNVKLTPLLYNMLKNSKDTYYINDINDWNFKIENDIEKNYIKKLLNIDDNSDKIDELTKERVGEKAIDNYYKHYKQLPKILDQNKFNKKSNSIYTKLLKSSSEKLLFPEKFGFIKIKGDEYDLNVENYNLNDKEGEIISKGLKEVRIKKINLSKNRFTSYSINKIIKNINDNLIYLDLSYNNIKESMEVLGNKIIKENLYLKVLKLRKTGINNRVTNNLLEIIVARLNLKILDLSDNNLNHEICENVNYLWENEEFKELYLRWNNLGNKGASELFPKLNDSNVVVLDLACNYLGELGKVGKDQFRSCIEEISLFIKKNKNLIHFDLSANNFSLRESIEISEALKKNYTIIGFHFSGNYGKIDDEGFLIFDEESLQNNLKGPMGLIEFDGFTKLNGKNESNICWICDGWRQVNIRCPKKLKEDDTPLFAHFDYNDFKPLYIHEKKNEDEYVLNCVVPKNKIIGFFSENFEPSENDYYDKIALNEFKEVNIDLSNNINYSLKTNIFNIISDNNYEKKILKEFQKNITNDYLINIKKENIVNIDSNFNYNIKIDVFPRTMKKYIPPKAKKIKKLWRFETSMFKDYQNDTEELLNKCFEFDFSNTKISSLIKNKTDWENAKNFLRKYYKQIKDFYKYYSSGSVSGIWSISSNVMLEIIGDFKIIDKFITIPEYDIIFAGISTEKKFKNDQKSYIVKHKFLELLTRIVNKKYVENQGMNILEGLELAFENNFLPIFNKFDHFKWRRERYWNEYCDNLIKNHKIFLEKLYTLYSGLKTMPGKKKFCCLEEFKKMIQDSDLIGDNLFDRDISICFNLSIITIKDELNIDRVNESYFIEFIEGIARISEKLSLPPLLEGYEDYSLDDRINKLPLHLKLESTFKKLYNCCLPSNLKKHIKFENKSFFYKYGQDEDI